MFKGQLLIFLIIYVRESSCALDALYDTGEKVWELYSMLNKSNFTSLSNSRTVAQLFGHNFTEIEKIRPQIYAIHGQLREIQKSINPQIIHDLSEILRSQVLLVRCIDTMGVFLTAINENYEKFYPIILQDSDNIDYSLDDLIRSVFPHIESNIQMMRKLITEPGELLPGNRNLMTAITAYVVIKYQEICNSSQPITEILVGLFKIAIIAEIKTSLMLIWANLQRYSENQEWKIVNILAKTQFQRYFGNYVNIIQQNLDLTGALYIRACDPENGTWILDENYYELEMTQAIIFRYQPAECPVQSCQNKWQKRSTRCDARYYDKRSGCSSTPTECEDLGTVQACVLKSGPHKFQYVNSTVLGFFGSTSKCPEDDGYIIDNGKVLDAVYATCGCFCNGNRTKISLLFMESRVESNMVITGLRFTRKNSILYIQPREGKLQANGHIHKYSEKWLTLPENIEESQIHYIDNKNSIFFLDDLFLPPKFILTGVRFNKVTRGTVTGFTIEIFGVPFDYKSGQLDHGEGVGLSPLREKSRRPLLFDQISPLQTILHNKPSSTNLKYVQLKQSSLKSDFGQSTLPLFDAVPVTTDPPSALGGIGIFHKGVEGYAGFISLRAYGIKYTEYFGNFTSAHTNEGRLQLFT